MPNRILRDTTDSEFINSLSFQAEVLFYRLIMKADDYGVFYAKPSLIKAALYPLRLESVREADITRWLAECEKAGLIAFYTSENKQLLVIVNFGQRMRNMKKRFPAPPADLLTSCGNPPRVAASCGELRPETRNEKRIIETRNEKGPPPEFISDLKADEILRERMCMNWDLTPQAQQKMIDAFILSCISRSKTHYDFNDFKSHFFSWSAKQYMDFKEKKKQMVD